MTFFIVIVEEGQKANSGQWFRVTEEDEEYIKEKLKESGWQPEPTSQETN